MGTMVKKNKGSWLLKIYVLIEERDIPTEKPNYKAIVQW